MIGLLLKFESIGLRSSKMACLTQFCNGAVQLNCRVKIAMEVAGPAVTWQLFRSRFRTVRSQAEPRNKTQRLGAKAMSNAPAPKEKAKKSAKHGAKNIASMYRVPSQHLALGILILELINDQ